MAKFKVSPTVPGNAVNVREEPGGAVVNTLSDGDVVEGAKDGEWVKIAGGYVMASLMRPVAAPKAAPAKKPAAPRKPAARKAPARKPKGE